MHLYLDTSVVVAAITREPHTDRARGLLTAPAADLVISDWTVTEVSAALSMKQRMGALRGADREAALRVFRRLARESLVMEHLSPADFARAAALADAAGTAVGASDMAGPAIRAGDALHLAVVERIGAVLATFDSAMARAAVGLGLDVLEEGLIAP